MSPDDPPIEIRVLGPLSVPVALPPRERTVLAALVVTAPHDLGIDDLTRAVWQGDPPAASLHQLHTAVSRVRRALGSAAIETTPAGYRLGSAHSDDLSFEAEIEAARTRSAEFEPGRAIELYRRALARWRSAPLPDLEGWDARDLWARRLESLRDDAEEELLAQRLAVGGHREALPDAERRIREHPWRESGWLIFALALYRSGRQADALTALRAGRSRLAGDLGLDPGPELGLLEQRILRRDPELDLPRPPPPATSTDNPYRGLIPYGPTDAALFFGREQATSQLLERIRRGGLVVVTGSSGAGKSSLVLAGVVPRLETEGFSVRVLHGSPGRLEDAEPCDVVILDQFEEVVGTGGPTSELESVVEGALTAGSSVVIVVRADFLDSLAAWPGLSAHLMDALHVVTPMTSEELRSAIEGPARQVGLRWESGFTAVVLRDAADRPGSLPHLSHALFETWLRREGDVLTIAGYEASGGIIGAIARTADEIYEELDAAERVICRSTILRLVSLGPDAPATRRRGSAAGLRRSAPRRQVVDRLISARLLAVEGTSITIAHESLLTAWPRLRDWLQDRAEDARRLGSLAAAAETWDADGRRPDDVWRGDRLSRLAAWRDADEVDLVPVETEFLEAGLALQRAEREERAQRARNEARQNRLLRGALVAVAGLLVVTLISTVAVSEGARQTAELADSQQLEALVATSLSLRDRDRDVAALLAAEAYLQAPDDPRAQAALMGSLTAAGSFLGRRYVATSAILGAGIPGTETAAVISDGLWGRLDLPSGQFRDFGLPPESADGSVVVSGDGRVAAHLELTHGETRVSVVDLEAGVATNDTLAIPRELTPNAALSRDGRTLYAVDATVGSLLAINMDDGSLRELPKVGVPATEGRGYPASVAVLESGVLAVGSSTSILLIDPVTLTRLEEISVPGGRATTAITAVDATTIAASGDSGLALIDLTDGSVVWERPYPRSQEFQCTSLAPSLTTGSVFCSGRGIFEFALNDGAPTGREFNVGSGTAATLVILDDAARLVAFGVDEPTIDSWALDGSGPVSQIIAAGRMAVDGFEPGGSRIIVATPPDPAELAADPIEWAVWDTETDAAVLGPSDDLEVIAWAGAGVVDTWDGSSPGDILINLSTGERRALDLPQVELSVGSRSGELGYSFGDGWVQAYDPETGEAVGPRMNPDGRAISVSDSADGSRLAVWVWRDTAPFRQVVVFDALSGEELARGLDDSSGAVISPDGLTIISNDATRLLVSDLTLSAVAALPTSGGSTADFPQIDADGRVVMLPTSDQYVALYDIRSQLALGDRIPATTRDYWPAGFLRNDGQALVVNVAEGVALWNLDLDALYAAACHLAGRVLTNDERHTYLPDSNTAPACRDVLGQ